MSTDNVAQNISRFTIRTSDRRTFRRCMRKWDTISSMRQNLTRKGTETNINFWFGTGIHFALEDFHGYNKYGDPRRAFYAYFKAFDEDTLPIGAESLYDLGMSMLSYYMVWYPKHNMAPQFETAWLDTEGNPVPANTEGASPAVEVKFMIPLDTHAIVDRQGNLIAQFKGEQAEYDGRILYVKEQQVYLCDKHTDEALPVQIVPIYYHGTVDKIVQDKLGRYWILDYKTAKGADTNKLDTDDQITAYLWAAAKSFKFPVYGFIYHQLTKDKVKEPKRLKDGTLSVDKKQKTTYGLLKEALIEEYGAVTSAPSKYIEFLNVLAEKESPEGDRFIRWDFIKRSPEQLENHQKAIYSELEIMLNTSITPYPNPTRDCIWDCPIRDACIAHDQQDSSLLEEFFKDWEPRSRDEDKMNGNQDDFLNHLLSPEQVAIMPLDDILNLHECMNIIQNSTSEDTDGFKFLYGDDEDV